MRLIWLAALGVAAGITPVNAADLGGNCCADLEERIAELEATTARKGNRKVTLTISGWVNEMIQRWDDGRESNTYVGTNNLEQSRVKFMGEAKITDGWSAGYTLEIGTWGHDSSRWNQASPRDPSSPSHDNSMQVRKSNWWIKSKDFGKVTVGLEGTATYHILDDADGANTRNVSDAEAASVYQGSFIVNSGGVPTGLKWSDVTRGFNNGTPGQSGRRNIVRYDSPEIAGFTATAAWGEDDMWDVALTYKAEIHDFKLLGKVGYGESTDPGATSCGGPTTGAGLVPPVRVSFDCSWFGAAGTIMHAPTGLYVFGGYGQQRIGSLTDIPANVGLDKTSTTWFIQPGIEQRWNSLGKTTIFGEYRHDDAGANPGKTLGANLNFYAAGVVQNVEAAAMDLYIMYRHADGDFASGTVARPVNNEIDAFDMVIGGALIRF